MVQNVIIERVMPLQSGEGKNGLWKKQKVLVRENAPVPHPDEHCITFFGEKSDLLAGISVGMEVQIVWEARVRLFTRQDRTEDYSNEAYGYSLERVS